MRRVKGRPLTGSSIEVVIVLCLTIFFLSIWGEDKFQSMQEQLYHGRFLAFMLMTIVIIRIPFVYSRETKQRQILFKGDKVEGSISQIIGWRKGHRLQDFLDRAAGYGKQFRFKVKFLYNGQVIEELSPPLNVPPDETLIGEEIAVGRRVRIFFDTNNPKSFIVYEWSGYDVQEIGLLDKTHHYPRLKK